MTLKRRRIDTDDAATLTDDRIAPEGGMGVALAHYLVRRFKLDRDELEEDDDSRQVSFSKGAYHQAAPRVGLTPGKLLQDIGTFDIHRSRIPTHFFKSIVMDMDTKLIEFGPPFEHETEEARSRFISPVFNHLNTLFASTLRNDPKTMIVGTQDYVEYVFRAFGAIAILVIEMTPKFDHQRLETIAQVINECDRCDLDNRSWNISLPIHCILINDRSFEYFKFERNPNPSIVRGCFPGDPMYLWRGLKLPDFSKMESSLPFVLQLRCICETIFDVMLSGYIAALTGYYDAAEQEDANRPRSLQLAEQALAGFREAEVQREAGRIDLADASVDRALSTLQQSTGAATTFYRSPPIMKDWDDTEVGRA